MLMLYYVLTYEAVRLSSMKTILVSGRKVPRHSHDILSDLPIKFLLQTAERNQTWFGGLYPQLLKLASTHFPHLCMVQDNLNEDFEASELEAKNGPGVVEVVKTAAVKEALSNLNSCPAKLILVMQKMLKMPAPDVWQFSELLVRQIKELMRPEVPQLVRGDVYLLTYLPLKNAFKKIQVAFLLSSLRKKSLTKIIEGCVTTSFLLQSFSPSCGFT